MTSVRLIGHKAVPRCGSFDVRVDGRKSEYFWDDEAGRRMRPEQMTSEQALEQAGAFARAERDRLEEYHHDRR